MPGLARHDLDALRLKIAALEKRPLLAEGAAMLAERLGRAANDRGENADPLELLAAPNGLLHEVFADEQRQSGAALGFTFGLARQLLTSQRQAVLYLQLAGEGQELGLPYGAGLTQFGIDPARLVIGRIDSMTELLWAMEEAIACRAVAGVIADLASHPKALDFTVSRRLSLRWRISPAMSGELPFDPRAPGIPRFQVEIEKGRLGDKTQRAEGKTMLVDWTENGFVSVEPRRRPAITVRRTAPPSRPVAAPLGHRLSQTG
jgi:protein ImuA